MTRLLFPLGDCSAFISSCRNPSACSVATKMFLFICFLLLSCPLFLLPHPTPRIRGMPVMFSRHDKLCAIMDSGYLLHNAIHACRYLLIPFFSSQYLIRFLSFSLEPKKLASFVLAHSTAPSHKHSSEQ